MPATARKPRKQQLSGLAARNLELKAYGPEPAKGKVYTTDTWQMQSFDTSWYSRNIDNDKLVAAFEVDLKNQNFNAAEIKAAKRGIILVGSWPMHISYARSSREATFPQETTDRWFKQVEIAINKGQGPEDAATNVINVVERTHNKAMQYVNDIEVIMDTVWEGDLAIADFKPVDIFADLGVKPAHLKVIATHFTTLRDDLQDNITNDCKGMDALETKVRKSEYTACINLYNKVINAANNVPEAPKAPRPASTKAQAKKVAARAQKVEAKNKAAIAAVNYMASDKEHGLTSVKPDAILGATTLITFNAKYKVLTIYRASTDAGFSLRGNMLLNVDDIKSRSKRIGRAANRAKEFVGNDKRTLDKLLEAVKGTPSEVRNRLNSDTVLIRAIK